jgi:transposase
MTDHTTMAKVSRLEVVATGARRRWTLEEKQRIVAESFSAPRNVSATARRHQLSNSQLFTWRRLAREGKLTLNAEASGFAAALVAPERAMTEEASGDWKASHGAFSGRMEIMLSGGRRVIVGSDVDASALARVLRALEQG